MQHASNGAHRPTTNNQQPPTNSHQPQPRQWQLMCTAQNQTATTTTKRTRNGNQCLCISFTYTYRLVHTLPLSTEAIVRFSIFQQLYSSGSDSAYSGWVTAKSAPFFQQLQEIFAFLTMSLSLTVDSLCPGEMILTLD